MIFLHSARCLSTDLRLPVHHQADSSGHDPSTRCFQVIRLQLHLLQKRVRRLHGFPHTPPRPQDIIHFAAVTQHHRDQQGVFHLSQRSQTLAGLLLEPIVPQVDVHLAEGERAAVGLRVSAEEVVGLHHGVVHPVDFGRDAVEIGFELGSVKVLEVCVLVVEVGGDVEDLGEDGEEDHRESEGASDEVPVHG